MATGKISKYMSVKAPSVGKIKGTPNGVMKAVSSDSKKHKATMDSRGKGK